MVALSINGYNWKKFGREGNTYLGYWCFRFYFLGLLLKGDNLVEHFTLQIWMTRILNCMYYYRHLYGGSIRAPHGRWSIFLQVEMGLIYLVFIDNQGPFMNATELDSTSKLESKEDISWNVRGATV